jgi:hypothetical protein
MALHPHDRPASVAIWHSSLPAPHSTPPPGGSVERSAPADAASGLLSRVLNDNRVVAGLAILLLTAAVLVTFT